MSRRLEITMSKEELGRFLEEERVVTCATVGPNGRPHLMPLWYVMVDGVITAWTFGKSQKARNLERDPRATLQVEAGDTYQELRGAMLECDVEIVRDLDAVLKIGTAVMMRYAPGATADDVRPNVERQAPKRVGYRFHPTRIVTWDHRKLGKGVY
jgi:PPOX class probable F420-dependent enzyme